MNDILGADPDALDAYAADARGLASMLDASTSAYQRAWTALYTASVVPRIGKPGPKGVVVQRAVDGIVHASTSVQGYADALRALDADADGQLAEDELPSADYLDLFLHIREDHRPHDVLDLDWDLSEWQIVAEGPEQRLAHIRRETDRIYALAEDLVDVNNDGSNGEPRQIRLDLNDPGVLDGYSQEDLEQVLELYGLDGRDGPLHFMVHGFQTKTGSLEKSGDSLADMYHERGEDDTTIVTVDWDSGNHFWSWDSARANADPAAAALTRYLDALNASNPDADVKMSVHSLGNKVAINALTDMADPDGLRIDYLAIEPAIPGDGYRKNPQDFGALTSDRIKTLTVTINDGDDALSKYYDYGTGNALGESEYGDDSIQDLLEARDAGGLDTTVIDHESGLGSETGEGHLSLDPDFELDDDSDKDHDGDPLRGAYEDQVGR
ncbi:hypothetical protein BH10ACT1_BH10ACT1_02210 [soil metagenome]